MKQFLIITLLLFSCTREQREIQKNIELLETRERDLGSRVHLLRNDMEQLVHRREVLTKEVSTLEQVKSGKRMLYVLHLKLRQERTGLDVFDIEGHIKDKMNESFMDIPVDKNFYELVSVNQVISKEFRYGSLILGGSASNFVVTVVNKYVKAE